jgi:hypothetical protein
MQTSRFGFKPEPPPFIFSLSSLCRITYSSLSFTTTRLLLDCLPFVSSSMALIFSRFSIHSLILYPCPSRKYCIRIIWYIASYAPTSSDSVELLVLIFCFLDIPIIDPLPNDIVAPVWPLHLSCVTKEACTHHLITFRLSDLSISGRCVVHLMYLNSRFSFT